MRALFAYTVKGVKKNKEFLIFETLVFPGPSVPALLDYKEKKNSVEKKRLVHCITLYFHPKYDTGLVI